MEKTGQKISFIELNQNSVVNEESKYIFFLKLKMSAGYLGNALLFGRCFAFDFNHFGHGTTQKVSFYFFRHR